MKGDWHRERRTSWTNRYFRVLNTGLYQGRCADLADREEGKRDVSTRPGLFRVRAVVGWV
jgi:hypothetical protein